MLVREHLLQRRCFAGLHSIVQISFFHSLQFDRYAGDIAGELERDLVVLGDGGVAGVWGGGPAPKRLPLSEATANIYRENGYRFVPLVREEFSLFCSLDILFLRRDFPAGVVSAGDLDNRIKTLIDALRKPQNANELRGNETPADGEDPFFCLLEDDDLVTGLSVQTDMLLDPPKNDSSGQGDVKLVISVELKPHHVTMFNLSFA